jgi:hypothetical protein
VVVVRIHPSVLQSDEAIVGILQHEAYELEAVQRTLGKSPQTGQAIHAMIDGTGARNLHGQAWDVADLRVLIMREHEPSKRAVLVGRLEGLLANFELMNFGRKP